LLKELTNKSQVLTNKNSKLFVLTGNYGFKAKVGTTGTQLKICCFLE